MKRYFLGINLGHDSSCALIEYNLFHINILFAASEERYTRIKHDDRFPVNSIKEALKNLPVGHIVEKLCYCTWEKDEAYNLWNRWMRSWDYPCPKYLEKIDDFEKLNQYRKNNFVNIKEREFDNLMYKEIIRDFVYDKCNLDIKLDEIVRIEHHLAHVLCAWYLSPFKQSHVFISDGIGDNISSSMNTIQMVEEDTWTIKREFSGSVEGSLGLFYKYITKSLNFKQLGDEGKVTGLAALGNPKKCSDVFEQLFIIDYSSPELIKGWNINNTYIQDFTKHDKIGGKFHPITKWTEYHAFGKQIIHLVNELLKTGINREDIAASAQFVLEKYTLKVLSAYFKNDNVDIALGGGVFANIKLNQRIKDLACINNLFIAPPMGDQGTSIGAAIAGTAINNIYKIDRSVLTPISMYLGNNYNDDEIEYCLSKYCNQIKYHKLASNEDIWSSAAFNLSQGKIIARFHGRMEFGPRALGHRSIYAPIDNPNICQILNQKLNREDFMPFAPITLTEKFHESYIENIKVVPNFRFMTISSNVSSSFGLSYSPVIHIDGTVRPQIIDHFSMDAYGIIKKYYDYTNKHTVINTSFNMHGEPIVCSPMDAIKSFIDSELDALYIENYLVTINN